MPTSQEVLDGAASSFHCTAPGCTYSKRDACGIVLHMRTHFVYETAEEEMPKATFLFKDGIYQCLDCKRKTDNRIPFREHVRHHILPFPYRCHCGTTVASIPDLRRHSSAAHPRTPLQMYFEDAEQLLEDIFSEIGPQKRTFWFQQRMRHESSPEVEIISDLYETSNCGSVLNESNVTGMERTDGAASRISVRKGNAEPRQKENFDTVPSAIDSRLGKGPSSADASVLKFSAEYNYINAFSYSTATKESDSAFCVLNVPDDSLGESEVDRIEVQGNTKMPENWLIDRQGSEDVSNLQSFDDSLLMPLQIDLGDTPCDITLPKPSCPIISKNSKQQEVASDTQLQTVLSPMIEDDSEVSPSSQDNGTECELDSLSIDERVPVSGPGKFVFGDEKFKCCTCVSWESDSEKLFKKHVWRHFHGISRICNNAECQSTECPLVLSMVMLVKCNSTNKDTCPNSRSSTPVSQLSTVSKTNDISPLKRSALEDLCDVEPSSPTGDDCAAQKNKDIDNRAMESAERLRFSAPTLNSLRSKACRHLSFSTKRVGDFAGKGENFQNADRDTGDCEEEVACATNTELISNESDATENMSTSKSGGDSNSPRKRKQTLVMKRDANQPVEHCRYSRDSTPLSTVCVQCSYTCNCSVQLNWHVESCHPKVAIKRKKEFCCTECGFSDNSKDTLIWHMAHHIGEHTVKVFACKYCYIQSTYMSRVMKHIFHSHPEKPMEVVRESTNIAYMDGIFKCPFCCSGYPWGSLFFKHIEVQHKLKKLADYLAQAYLSKCCPEVIEFPKHLISESVTGEGSKHVQSSKDTQRSKDIQSSCDKSDTTESDKPCCNKNENVSTIQQHRKHATDSIESSHSRNPTETDDRKKSSEFDPSQNSELKGTSVSKLVALSSAKSLAQERSGDVDKNTSRDVQKPDSEMNSEKPIKIRDKPNGNTGHLTIRPGLGKSTQNDVIYNSTKRRIKKYQAPKASKSSFLISPSHVPSLPRNLGNHTTSDFEKSLPNQFIFAQAIKCPKCYHTDRIRLNLIRHYNGHLTDAGKGAETSETSNLQSTRGDGVTFALWDPKDLHEDAPDKLVGNKRKTRAVAQEEKDKERFQRTKKGPSERYKRTVKRARLTDEASKCISSNKTEAASSDAVISLDDPMSGHRSTTGGDIHTTDASKGGSSPAFGQFLQNHALKIVPIHTCESCSKAFTSETEREKHAKDIHSSTYYVCRCCGIMIHGLPNVRLHFKETHPGSMVLVDEWVSAQESQKRIRPFSEVSDIGIPTKKMKISTDADKGELPEKSDSEKDDLQKNQKWSSFYGANSRKQPASNTIHLPTVGATIDELTTLNMTVEVSSSCSLRTTCATTASATYASTDGNAKNELDAPNDKLMTSHSVAASSFVPPLGGNNLLATFMTNLLAANLMTNRTVPGTQVPTTQMMGAQIPSSVERSAPATMVRPSLPLPGIQPAMDTSGFANLLASLLMANLAAGTGMTVPNENATPRETLHPFQSASDNLNVLRTSTDVQHEPLMPELIKEAPDPLYCSNMGSLNAHGSSVGVQNDTCVAVMHSKGKRNPSLASTLVPGALSSVAQDSSREFVRKPMCKTTSGSKMNRLSDYDNLCSSETESIMSGVSQRSNYSRSSGSISVSNKSSKPHSTRKLKKNHMLRYDTESVCSDIEICSSISSVSTAGLSKKGSRCSNSSPISVADCFADHAFRMCCIQCAYKTYKLDSFEKHLSWHVENKQPAVDPILWKPVQQKCGFCNFRTFLDEDFEEHAATHMVKKPFQCSYCSFSGFTKASVNRHLRKLHPELEPIVIKNVNVRLKHTVPHSSVAKVSLNATVRLKNVLNRDNKALKRLCKKYQLVKLDLRVK